MAQEFDDVVVTVMDSGVSISFRDGYSIDVPEHIIKRSTLLRQTIETVDTGGVTSLSILKGALASWLKYLRGLTIGTDGETLLKCLKV